ncbi:hypothetical protein GHK78_09010, partial [Sinorhizobium meliloti]|nr:hypothetical protein [Sinorhizobium meliloti]MQW20276.1 hypothetical protein [Sinorhizobium meliloti]MQW26440.1 hypothetical protein [Sinorhizobium meliloti]MQX63203.1 hypothetical protein [Sinorhizobium meliloti]MQX72727.1 hypothetical protein [Sinorhizobium meliloti]
MPPSSTRACSYLLLWREPLPWGETGFQLCGLPTASLGRGEGQAACRLPPCGGEYLRRALAPASAFC